MTIAQSFDGFSGLSPEEQSPSNTNSLALFDGDDTFDLDSDQKPKPKSTGAANRKGPGAADKRATHNAIERARRESLNGRFMTLAEALPSMAKVKRPSKSVIVQNALSFVYDAQVKEHALIRENNELRRQVDQLRRQLGMAPLPPPAPLTGAGSSTTPPASSSAAAAPLKPSMNRNESFADSITSATSMEAAGALTMSMGQLDPSAHSPIMMHQLSPASGSFPSPPSSSGLEQHQHHHLGTSPQLAGMFSTPGLSGANATLFSPTVTSTTSLGDSPPAAGAFSPSTASELMEERRQSSSAAAAGPTSAGTSSTTFGSFSAVQQAQAAAQAQAQAQAQAHAHAQQQHLMLMHQAALQHQHQQQQAQQQHQQQQHGVQPSSSPYGPGGAGPFTMNPAASMLAAQAQHLQATNSMFAAAMGHHGPLGMGVGVGVGMGAMMGAAGVSPFELYGMGPQGQAQGSWGAQEQNAAFGGFS